MKRFNFNQNKNIDDQDYRINLNKDCFINSDQLFIDVIFYCPVNKGQYANKYYCIVEDKIISVNNGSTTVLSFRDGTLGTEKQCDGLFQLCKYQNPAIEDNSIIEYPTEPGWYCDPWNRLLLEVKKGLGGIKYYAFIHNVWVDLDNVDYNIFGGSYFKVQFNGPWCFLRNFGSERLKFALPNIKCSELPLLLDYRRNSHFECFGSGNFRIMCIGGKMSLTLFATKKYSFKKPIEKYQEFLQLPCEKAPPMVLKAWNGEFRPNAWYLNKTHNLIFTRSEFNVSRTYLLRDGNIAYISSDFICHNFNGPCDPIKFAEIAELENFRYVDMAEKACYLKLLLCLKHLKIRVPKYIIFIILGINF